MDTAFKALGIFAVLVYTVSGAVVGGIVSAIAWAVVTFANTAVPFALLTPVFVGAGIGFLIGLAFFVVMYFMGRD